jgi:plastocyanin
MKQGKLLVAAAVLAVGVLGCKPKESPAPAGPAPAASAASTAPVGNQPALPMTAVGSVSGTVHFTGKAPAPVKIDMSMDPACDMSGGGDNMSEQFAVHGGKLANVFIYVKSGPPAAFTIGVVGPPVVMDQKGCRYIPHVIGVLKGQSVEFRNSDLTMHNIHTLPTAPGAQSIDLSQSPKGTPQVKQFNLVETMIPVRCNNHPWMNAFINVSQTPFFAVTDEDGKFSISGMPAGDYTLAAVHEKLGEQTMKVTVKPQATADGNFTFAAK